MKTPAKDWYYSLVPSNQTPNDIPTQEIQANSAYINLHLKSMRITNVRNGFQTFYPAVHSFVSLKYIGNSNPEFNVVTTPNQLAELDKANIDKVININKRLLGPVPFRGGDLNFDIGLFSIKSGDLSKPFLSLLTDMSNLAGVSFIGRALPFMDPISKGVELLVGNTNTTELEVGMSTNYDKVITGYYVIIAADKSKIDLNQVYVDHKDYKVIDAKGNLFQAYPYLVFAISSTDKKEDWFDIPELAVAFKKLQDDVRAGDINASTDSLKFFKRIVLTSNDLLFRDAKEIVKQVEEEIMEILQTMQVAKSDLKELKNLSEFKIYYS